MLNGCNCLTLTVIYYVTKLVSLWEHVEMNFSIPIKVNSLEFLIDMVFLRTVRLTLFFYNVDRRRAAHENQRMVWWILISCMYHQKYLIRDDIEILRPDMYKAVCTILKGKFVEMWNVMQCNISFETRQTESRCVFTSYEFFQNLFKLLTNETS